MVTKKLDIKKPGVNPAEALVKEMAGVKPATEKKEVPATEKPKVRQRKATAKKVEKEKISFDDIYAPKEEKELRNVAVNLRVKKSVKDDFDNICRKLGKSQSDMLEFWVKFTLEQMYSKNKI